MSHSLRHIQARLAEHSECPKPIHRAAIHIAEEIRKGVQSFWAPVVGYLPTAEMLSLYHPAYAQQASLQETRQCREGTNRAQPLQCLTVFDHVFYSIFIARVNVFLT